MKLDNLTKEQKKDIILTNGAIQINDCIIEDVVLGNIQPCEKIPLEDYMHYLRLPCGVNELRAKLSGFAIGENGCVSRQHINDFRSEFFNKQITRIFLKNPILEYSVFGKKALSREIEDKKTFFKKIYDIFQKVINIQEYEDIKTFSLSPENALRVEKFVAAIKLLKLQNGRKVSFWLARVRNRPEYLKRMTRVKWATLILDNNDTDSLEYKLSVLSTFRFIQYSNSDLFAKRLLRYYELNDPINRLTYL